MSCLNINEDGIRDEYAMLISDRMATMLEKRKI